MAKFLPITSRNTECVATEEYPPNNNLNVGEANESPLLLLFGFVFCIFTIIMAVVSYRNK